jgi:hypothetical protein
MENAIEFAVCDEGAYLRCKGRGEGCWARPFESRAELDASASFEPLLDEGGRARGARRVDFGPKRLPGGGGSVSILRLGDAGKPAGYMCDGVPEGSYREYLGWEAARVCHKAAKALEGASGAPHERVRSRCRRELPGKLSTGGTLSFPILTDAAFEFVDSIRRGG